MADGFTEVVRNNLKLISNTRNIPSGTRTRKNRLDEVKSLYLHDALMPSKEDEVREHHSHCDKDLMCDYQVTTADKRTNLTKLKESIACLKIRLAKYRKWGLLYGTAAYAADFERRRSQGISRAQTEFDDMINHRHEIYVAIAYIKRCINALLYRNVIPNDFNPSLKVVFDTINGEIKRDDLILDIYKVDNDNKGKRVIKTMKSDRAEFQAKKELIMKKKRSATRKLEEAQRKVEREQAERNADEKRKRSKERREKEEQSARNMERQQLTMKSTLAQQKRVNEATEEIRRLINAIKNENNFEKQSDLEVELKEFIKSLIKADRTAINKDLSKLHRTYLKGLLTWP